MSGTALRCCATAAGLAAALLTVPVAPALASADHGRQEEPLPQPTLTLPIALPTALPTSLPPLLPLPLPTGLPTALPVPLPTASVPPVTLPLSPAPLPTLPSLPTVSATPSFGADGPVTAYATGVPVAGDPVAGPKIPAAAVVAPVLVQLGPPQHPTSAIIAPDVQAAAVSQRSLTAVHSQLSGASSSAASPYGSERSISQQLATTAYLASSVLALFGVLLLVGRRMWRHGRTIS